VRTLPFIQQQRTQKQQPRLAHLTETGDQSLLAELERQLRKHLSGEVVGQVDRVGGVDLSHSFDDYSTPYREPVPSLAVA
jgi:hypothetical protein